MQGTVNQILKIGAGNWTVSQTTMVNQTAPGNAGDFVDKSGE